jgi:hypothetical protein
MPYCPDAHGLAPAVELEMVACAVCAPGHSKRLERREVDLQPGIDVGREVGGTDAAYALRQPKGLRLAEVLGNG